MERREELLKKKLLRGKEMCDVAEELNKEEEHCNMLSDEIRTWHSTEDLKEVDYERVLFAGNNLYRILGNYYLDDRIKEETRRRIAFVMSRWFEVLTLEEARENQGILRHLPGQVH